MAIRLVTFDLDDTLWDSSAVLHAAEARLRDWLREHAPQVAEAFESGVQREIRAQVLAEDPNIIHNLSELRRRVLEQAMRLSGHSDRDSIELSQRGFAAFLEARQNVRLFEGVLPMLESLKRSYVLGALSNGNANIAIIGLNRFFSFHFSAESVGVGKPAPEIFQAAMEWANVEPAQTVHVGDHPEHDMLGAARLGIHTIWFNTRCLESLEGVTPSRVASSLEDIPKLIASIDHSA